MIARRPAALAPALALALASSSACTKILGIDYQYQGTGGAHGTASSTASKASASSSSTGAPQTCGAFVWDPLSTCQKCMEASCCTELQACDHGTPCDEMMTCERACNPTDEACKKACFDADTTQHGGNGYTAYSSLLYCYSYNCFETSGCDFQVCDSTFFWAERGCADCLGADATCCAAFTTCANDSVCAACVDDPTGQGCSVNTNFQATQACVNGTCQQQCTETLCGSDTYPYVIDDCNYCLSQANGGCCAEYATCTMDMQSLCTQCLSGMTSAGCQSDTNYQAWTTCMNMNCQAACDFL